MSIDSGILIVDDDLDIDQESVHEQRKAYLEEARSQEASSDQKPFISIKTDILNESSMHD